eukprot:TRINITY_DN684_c0_g1_i1.p1 TRINITY_DN684_c0_g1~~TRINITY_DN684_c0_g1_i1.p1  ORF type:complete len:1028 (-),score=135.47 TRINITY_DN684_c0_g1_i1:14453-17536(-)
MGLSSPCTAVPRNPATDVRRLQHAVDRLDAIEAHHREEAARFVFDTCVYHVRRTLKTHPARPNRGHGRREPPTLDYVFDIVYPYINRIARRLDRAMRHAEMSTEPQDAAALIVAVDAQGALAALFAVAQNAGCERQRMDILAVPLRKRSAPALLRTLFCPDMRVTNAATKALKQISAIECCQISSWMGSIRAALSLKTANRTSRAVLLRNLLGRLADILHEAVRQSALSASGSSNSLARKRSSRSSFGNLLVKQRRSLSSERRKEQRRAVQSQWKILRWFQRKKQPLANMSASFSRLTSESDASDRASARKSRQNSARSRDVGDSLTELQQLMSAHLHPNNSLVSAVTESISSAHRFYGGGNLKRDHPRISMKRDAATVMYIFERLLSHRITPDLDERIEIISTLSDIASETFSGQYASSHKIEQVESYSEAMRFVFVGHGEDIYSMLLSILFRPVRESDANQPNVVIPAGIADLANQVSAPRPRISRFPQNAICLPNMDCTALASVSCNTLLKQLLKHVPDLCSRRMALMTGTINSAFLYSSEALQRSQEGLSWEVSKIVSAVDSLSVLVFAIPTSPELAVEHISRDPVTLRLVIETCIRSVSATGRLLAHNAARPSAPKLSDEGTLDSLRSWKALISITPSSPQWSGTPSYSSSILFLAQAARRAALIAVMQGYRREKRAEKHIDETLRENESYPSGIVSGPSTVRTSPVSFDDANGNGTNGLSGNPVGFEADDDNVLTTELHQAIIALLNVPGSNPAEIFFELYRTVVYLYANDLRKQYYHAHDTMPPDFFTEQSATRGIRRSQQGATFRSRSRTREVSTQSDEDAKGILVDNIAVDGQLPSRALRRAVMVSEIDLGKYFDVGQPPSLQHLSPHQTGLPPGVHTFEEFSHALAIIIGTLANKTITENFEDPQEAAAMISRDVNRSGSPYLRRIHKRAKSILRRDMLGQDFDWKSVKYEERIKKLEEQVATLRAFLVHGIETGTIGPRRKSFSNLLGSPCTQPNGYTQHEIHEYLCTSSRCFCIN